MPKLQIPLLGHTAKKGEERMRKEEYIKKYGEAAWEKKRQQAREWSVAHPEEAKAHHQEANRKGGKYYDQCRTKKMQGIPHEKELVRGKHREKWRPYKKVIAPDSVLHHEWIPETSEYRGVALVEKDPHQYGYVDVIQILEGEITLLTEAEVRGEEIKNE